MKAKSNLAFILLILFFLLSEKINAQNPVLVSAKAVSETTSYVGHPIAFPTSGNAYLTFDLSQRIDYDSVYNIKAKDKEKHNGIFINFIQIGQIQLGGEFLLKNRLSLVVSLAYVFKTGVYKYIAYDYASELGFADVKGAGIYGGIRYYLKDIEFYRKDYENSLSGFYVSPVFFAKYVQLPLEAHDKSNNSIPFYGNLSVFGGQLLIGRQRIIRKVMTFTYYTGFGIRYKDYYSHYYDLNSMQVKKSDLPYPFQYPLRDSTWWDLTNPLGTHYSTWLFSFHLGFTLGVIL